MLQKYEVLNEMHNGYLVAVIRGKNKDCTKSLARFPRRLPRSDVSSRRQANGIRFDVPNATGFAARQANPPAKRRPERSAPAIHALKPFCIRVYEAYKFRTNLSGLPKPLLPTILLLAP